MYGKGKYLLYIAEGRKASYKIIAFYDLISVKNKLCIKISGRVHINIIYC